MDPAEVAFIVRKRGTSLAALARANGLSSSAIRYALKYPARRAEEALIAFLGLPPIRVFPDRYDAQGTRRVGRWAKRVPAISSRRRIPGQ